MHKWKTRIRALNGAPLHTAWTAIHILKGTLWYKDLAVLDLKVPTCTVTEHAVQLNKWERRPTDIALKHVANQREIST